VRRHAAEYPRDALPLSLALGVFGLLGFSGRCDHHEAQLELLEELAPHWGEDWWFLGYLGWAYIETGEVAAGTRLVERSLAGNPRNAHAAHQRVHGFFEAGDATGGAGFIEDWLKGYERAGHLHCHLSWHWALFELACGNAEHARAIYLDSIRPSVAQAVPMLVLAGSASFLRLCLCRRRLRLRHVSAQLQQAGKRDLRQGKIGIGGDGALQQFFRAGIGRQQEVDGGQIIRDRARGGAGDRQAEAVIQQHHHLQIASTAR